MGLDGVELVMEVEDHFGITIPEDEAGRVRTVEDLVSLIHDRTCAAHVAYCPNLRAFFSLRAAVREVTNDNTLRLRPSYAIVEVLTPPQRRLFWDRLAVLLGTFPRDLERPRLLRRFLALAVLVLLFIAVATAIGIDVRTIPLTLAIAVTAICCLLRLTVRFCTVPPNGWATFGELATKLVGKSVATKHLGLRTREDVLHELQPIIVETLGVDRDEVVPSARFIEDLGIG